MQRGPSQPISPANAPRLAEVVAGELRRRILTGELENHATLPKQDDLLGEFGVSTPTLREALRILEAEGLIQVQRGKLGGSVVHRPTPATAAYAIATVLQTDRVDLPDVAIALQQLEPLCLELAANRPDRHESVTPTLRSLNERSAKTIDDEEEYRRIAHELHREFVSASGSRTLTLLASALEALWFAHASELAATRRDEDRATRDVRVAHVAAHAAIIDAVERGEADEVRALARQHLCEATRHSLSAAEGIAIDSTSITPARSIQRVSSR